MCNCQRECVNHCVCQRLWVGGVEHTACCKCGDRQAVFKVSWTLNQQPSTTFTNGQMQTITIDPMIDPSKPIFITRWISV